MLKRIFNRNKKGFFRKSKPKKAKVSKYNKLNISTDETNMNTYSFIESGPSIDDADDEIDLPKLNFTCILNNPLEESNYNSLFGQLLSRFQEDQKIVTEEERIKKEGHKFDIIDIIQDDSNNNISYENKILKKIGKSEEEEEQELDDILNDLEQLENIFSSKKTLEQCIKETNAELFKDKKTFKLKKFVDLSYNNYIAKIKHEYLIYRDNHKKNIIQKLKLEKDLLNIDNIKLNNQEEILNQINNYRKALNISMEKIGKEFKIETKDFKIKDELLDLEIENILGMIQKLIEQKGIVELESEKSNINYDLIKYYFVKNYPLSISNVENMQFKVNNLINKKNLLKSKFIDISQKLILIRIKRQNMVKLLNIYKSMIYANCDKIDTINEIVDIRETKEKLKNIPDIGINIVQKIDTELTNRENNINNENINKVTTLIKNEINNSLSIDSYSKEENETEDGNNTNEIKDKYNYKYYNIDEALFKQITEYKKDLQENLKLKENTVLIMNSIDVDFIKKKLYSYLDLAENKEDFMNNIHETFMTSIEEVILTTLGKILPLKNINEILYLFYIGKMSQYLLDSINKILEEKDKEKLIGQIYNKLSDIVDKNLFYIFDDIQINNNMNINSFIFKKKLMNNVLNAIPIILENKNFVEKEQNYEIDFVDNFWKEKCNKIKDGLNSDNLRCLDNISFEYQKFINVIFSFDINWIKNNEEKKNENLKNNILFDVNLTLKEDEPKEINLIEINKISEGNIIKKNFRLISSMLNIISITIDTIKMILYFEQKTHSKILLNYHQVLSTFINLSNDIVLETKGQIKNITQNELASSYGSIKIIQEIITQFISYIAESSYLEDEIKIKYKELDTLAKEYLEKNLLKLNNMIKEGIYDSSINEFKKIISLDKYPIVKGSLPINPFAENIVKLVKNVNKSLKHCYEDETISKIILDNLNIFNDELEKLMDNKKELNGEEKKQFKKDFTFIRKNIDNGIDEIDFKGFKKKLNAIHKKGDKGDDKDK